MAAYMQETPSQSLNQLLFHSLHILITPSGTKSSEDETEVLFDSMLEKNLSLCLDFVSKNPALAEKVQMNNLGESFQVSSPITVRQKITETFLMLISCITKNLDEANARQKSKVEESNQSIPSVPEDALSVQQEKILSTSLQFLLVLGLLPYLSPGISIPVSQRLGPGQILLASPYDYSTELDDLERLRLILPVLRVFCDMLAVPTLQSLILTHYLQDLISALVYIRYCARVVMKKCDLAPWTNTKIRDENKLARSDEFDSSIISNLSSTLLVYPLTKASINLDSQQQPWTLYSTVHLANVNIDLAIRSSSTQKVIKTLVMLNGAGKASDVPIGSPVWYHRTIASIIRDVLMVPPAVHHFMICFLGDSHDWGLCQAIGGVISRCPVPEKKVVPFYTAVSQQLIELVQSSQVEVQAMVVRAVGATLSNMTQERPDLMKEVCLSPLHSPLLQLALQPDVKQPDGLILSESLLQNCMETLHKIYMIGQPPQSKFVLTMSPIIGILFSIFGFTRTSHCHLRTLSEDLIKCYLSCCDTIPGQKCVMALVLQSPDLENYSSIHPNIRLSWGPCGGVQAVKDFSNVLKEDMTQWALPADSALDILSSLNNMDLIFSLFLHLLQKLTDIITAETKRGDILLPSLQPPTTVQLMELREKFTLVSLLAALGEKFGQEVVQSSQQILTFAKVTLERCLKVCQSSEEETTKMFEWETVSMALSLLTTVLGGGIKLTDEDKKLLDELLPVLTEVSVCQGTDPMVREMAEDLKIAVATRGVVWGEMGKPHEKKKTSSDRSSCLQSTKRLIEVLSETKLNDREAPTDSAAAHGRLQQALQDLSDPLLPVKGHGLISLSRLVEDRDSEVISKSDLLLQVFSEHLVHTDSYIYLAAVNGLATLADLNPKLVIPCLTAEFRSQCCAASPHQKNDSFQTVLKVGEALVKATKRLGELTPYYRDTLLSAVLVGCRHSDALVRASSLSGLAEISKLLRFAVGPVQHEIVTCCRDVVCSDPDPEPRKAAALTLSQLIQGLGEDSLKALDDVVVDIYRALKLSLASDQDVNVQLNVRLALNELDRVMRDALFRKPEYVKTISILGYQ